MLKNLIFYLHFETGKGKARPMSIRVTKSEMIEHLSKISFYSENIQIVNKIHEFGANQIILSCGHTLFIETILSEYNLLDKMDAVIANESKWDLIDYANTSTSDTTVSTGHDDDDKNDTCIQTKHESLVEKPFLNQAPLHCKQYKIGLCSPHMCKGSTIDKIILPQYARYLVSRNKDIDGNNNNNNNNNNSDKTKQKKIKMNIDSSIIFSDEKSDMKDIDYDVIDHIIYIGDGGGDYCGLTRLRKDKDFAFVRKGFKLEKLVNFHFVSNNSGDNLDEKLQEKMKSADKLNIDMKQIIFWQNGQDLLDCFKAVLPNAFK